MKKAIKYTISLGALLALDSCIYYVDDDEYKEEETTEQRNEENAVNREIVTARSNAYKSLNSLEKRINELIDFHHDFEGNIKAKLIFNYNIKGFWNAVNKALLESRHLDDFKRVYNTENTDDLAFKITQDIFKAHGKKLKKNTIYAVYALGNSVVIEKPENLALKQKNKLLKKIRRNHKYSPYKKVESLIKFSMPYMINIKKAIRNNSKLIKKSGLSEKNLFRAILCKTLYESHFNRKALSSAAAAGQNQIIRDTAVKAKMNVDKELYALQIKEINKLKVYCRKKGIAYHHSMGTIALNRALCRFARKKGLNIRNADEWLPKYDERVNIQRSYDIAVALFVGWYLWDKNIHNTYARYNAGAIAISKLKRKHGPRYRDIKPHIKKQTRAFVSKNMDMYNLLKKDIGVLWDFAESIESLYDNDCLSRDVMDLSKQKIADDSLLITYKSIYKRLPKPRKGNKENNKPVKTDPILVKLAQQKDEVSNKVFKYYSMFNNYLPDIYSIELEVSNIEKEIKGNVEKFMPYSTLNEIFASNKNSLHKKSLIAHK